MKDLAAIMTDSAVRTDRILDLLQEAEGQTVLARPAGHPEMAALAVVRAEISLMRSELLRTGMIDRHGRMVDHSRMPSSAAVILTVLHARIAAAHTGLAPCVG